MHHVVGQIAEEPLGILHVEGVVIGLDQAGGGSMRHGPRTPVTHGTIRLPLHSLRQPRLPPSPSGGCETAGAAQPIAYRSEAPTSELQSLLRISYAVFCLKKKSKSHT